ncbi:serine/threonine-protein kinase/endoribonuclease Ire1p [Monosporozyma servazzii]
MPSKKNPLRLIVISVLIFLLAFATANGNDKLLRKATTSTLNIRSQQQRQQQQQPHIIGHAKHLNLQKQRNNNIIQEGPNIVTPEITYSTDGVHNSIRGRQPSTALPASYLVGRTLNDLTLSDLIIATDVEGCLHALNRTTGVLKWSVNSSEFAPLVNIEQPSSMETKETLIVEPSGDGLLYFFHANQGLQRIPASVSQLIDTSPVYMRAQLVIDDSGTIVEDEKIYTGSRTSVMYTIDLDSGDIVSAYGATTGNFGKYFKNSNDNEECPVDPSKLLNIGKAIYNLQISGQDNSVYNVTYSSWKPNSLDSHLSLENTKSEDSLFITPFREKTLLAVETDTQVAKWISSEFPGIVTTVFDVFVDNYSFETVLVTHPFQSIEDEESEEDMVYLEQIENHSWVAFSTDNYPSLVKAAPLSKYVSSDNWKKESIFNDENLFKTAVTGVHLLHKPKYQVANHNPIAPPHTPLLLDPVTYEPISLDPRQVANNKVQQANASGKKEVGDEKNRRIKSSVFLYILKFCYKIFENGLILIISLIILGCLQKFHLIPPLGTVLGIFGIVPYGTGATNETTSNEPAVKVEDNTNTSEKEAGAKDSSPISTLDTLVKEASEGSEKKKRKRGARGGKKNKRKGHILDIQESPDNLKSLTVSDKILGYGSSGTVVFEGKFQGRPVAVKRMLLDFCDLADREIKLLTESDNHSNVIRYYCSESTEKFLYIALELCNANLQDIIERKNPQISIPDSLIKSLDPVNILYQIASGVEYLHSLKIIHRDLKPQNILMVSTKVIDKKTELEYDKIKILISDFGLCKKLEADQSSFRTNMHNPAGTTGWRAPELLDGSSSRNLDISGNTITSRNDSLQDTSIASTGSFYDPYSKQRLTRAVDIFSLGCVFYYVLSRGEHPFGDKYIREANIITGEYDLGLLKQTVDYESVALEATDLVGRMISKNPNERPTAAAVLKHPLFWSVSKKLMFLLKFSDRFEVENKEPSNLLLVKLNDVSSTVIKNRNWSSKFDQKFMDNLGKYRKYHFERVLDLLRAIRNKYHHFIDLPPDLANEMGPIPGGFYEYFIKKFPNLLMEVYLYVEENMADDQMFVEFF